MEDIGYRKRMMLISRRYQRDMRILSAVGFFHQLLVVLGLTLGVIGVITVVASSASLLFVISLHYRQFGSIKNWWWLRRGVIIVSPFETTEASRQWCNNSNYQFKEIFPGVFKFYHTRDAVHFKLACL